MSFITISISNWNDVLGVVSRSEYALWYCGPMPIVMMSIVKALFQQRLAHLHASTTVLVLICVVIVIALLTLLIMELIEYRTNYKDIMNASNQDIKRIWLGKLIHQEVYQL